MSVLVFYLIYISTKLLVLFMFNFYFRLKDLWDALYISDESKR